MSYNFKGKVDDDYKKKIKKLREGYGFSNIELLKYMVDNIESTEKEQSDTDKEQNDIDNKEQSHVDSDIESKLNDIEQKLDAHDKELKKLITFATKNGKSVFA